MLSTMATPEHSMLSTMATPGPYLLGSFQGSIPRASLPQNSTPTSAPLSLLVPFASGYEQTHLPYLAPVLHLRSPDYLHFPQSLCLAPSVVMSL